MPVYLKTVAGEWERVPVTIALEKLKEKGNMHNWVFLRNFVLIIKINNNNMSLVGGVDPFSLNI